MKKEKRKKKNLFTTAISGIKGDIIDSYAATRSIWTPYTFEHDIEICVLINVSLSVAPSGTLIIVQLPYRFSFRTIALRLHVQSQDAYENKNNAFCVSFFVVKLDSCNIYSEKNR